MSIDVSIEIKSPIVKLHSMQVWAGAGRICLFGSQVAGGLSESHSAKCISCLSNLPNFVTLWKTLAAHGVDFETYLPFAEIRRMLIVAC
jgi:hypothetical protein